MADDAGYASDRLLYNARFANPLPRAIAYCASADDVARCVDFATSHHVDLTSRSGGHSYAGYSTCPGLVVDVSAMSGVRVDVARRRATVGAGARLIDVYNEVGSHGLLVPGGSCPTVGIAGLALGGGIGVFSRRYAMTSDNIASVSVVDGGASAKTADNAQHEDLYWALRGGGGGNFAVATSFEFELHPMPEVTLFTLQYPWSAAATLVGAWQEWIRDAPDELWANCQLLSQGSDGLLAQTSGVWCGPSAALTTVLGRLTRVVGAPSYRFVGERSYLEAMMVEAGCEGLTVAACHLTGSNPSARLSREAYAAKSNYVIGTLSDARAAAHVHAVEHLAGVAPYLGGGLAFDAYGGAINRVASASTAFVHRDATACIQATYSWGTYSSPTEIANGARWLTWLQDEVFDPSAGAYQNYIDPTLPSWARAYYGDNLERLVAVKRRYDPDDVFHFAQSIPLTV